MTFLPFPFVPTLSVTAAQKSVSPLERVDGFASQQLEQPLFIRQVSVPQGQDVLFHDCPPPLPRALSLTSSGTNICDAMSR